MHGKANKRRWNSSREPIFLESRKRHWDFESPGVTFVLRVKSFVSFSAKRIVSTGAMIRSHLIQQKNRIVTNTFAREFHWFGDF